MSFTIAPFQWSFSGSRETNGKNLPFTLLLVMVTHTSFDLSVVTCHLVETPSIEMQYSEFSEDTGILNRHSSQSQTSPTGFLSVLCMGGKGNENACLLSIRKKNHIYPCQTCSENRCDEYWTRLSTTLLSDKKLVSCFNTGGCVSTKMFLRGILELKTLSSRDVSASYLHFFFFAYY